MIDAHIVQKGLLSKVEMSVKIIRGYGFLNRVTTFVRATMKKSIHNRTQMGYEIWRSCGVKNKWAKVSKWTTKEAQSYFVSLFISFIFFCIELHIVVQSKLLLAILFLCKILVGLLKCSSRLSPFSVTLSGLHVGIFTAKGQIKSHPCCHLNWIWASK